MDAINKKLKVFITVCLLLIGSSANAEVNWKVSSSRTNVKFKVKHFVLMEVEGRFKNPQGLVVTASESDFSNAHIEAHIPVKTISTGNIDRDTHLKQAVFFDADKFPEMMFKSKKVTQRATGEFLMSGNLTIRGVTKPVIFNVTYDGTKKAKDGNARSKFIAKGILNRYDYGLKWNELTEAGAMVVGENVEIEMDVTLEKANTSLATISTAN